MKEQPILMSTENVKAILAGRKTQTRRVIKPQPTIHLPYNEPDGLYYPWKYKCKGDPITREELAHLCPYGQVGDRLWCKHRYDLFDKYFTPIEGFDQNYVAGTDGHIYRVGSDEPLKETPTGDKGYLSVSLSHGNLKSTQLVHRLIVKAYYGLPPVDTFRTQTRHMDGNNQNNKPGNLDWGTQEDNWADRKVHGRGMGEQHHSSKLTMAQAILIRQSPLSQRQLAHIYGVSQPTIQAVLSGKYWQDTKKQLARNYPEWQGWKSPLFMPRWASRINLEITEIRVERLQEITHSPFDRDCHAEGFSNPSDLCLNDFMRCWDSLNPKYPWESNPWVWVLTFKVI